MGKHIRSLVECHFPNRYELDITNLKSCIDAREKYRPDIVIHDGAWTDMIGAELYKEDCWKINVTGTENVAKTFFQSKIVYISTEFVFDGEKGNYKESDLPHPINFYSLTKLLGEIIIRQYPHHLIIRTAYCPDGPWSHSVAYIDQWSSHEFASVIAPDIAKAAIMDDLEGIIHIAGERKSAYELAKSVNSRVGSAYITSSPVRLPRDTSLNSSKWKKILSQQNLARK